MGPVHPLFVHLPIGLLIGNAILTLWYLRRTPGAPRPDLEQAAFHCLQLGLFFIVPTIAAGTWDAVAYLSHPGAHDQALGWINAHAFSGVLVLLVYWQAWNMRRRNPAVLESEQRRGYLARLVVGSVLLTTSGWIGGHMVYSLGISPQT